MQSSVSASPLHPQSFPQPNSILQSNHLIPLNLQFQRTFPMNPMNMQYSPQIQQQYGLGFSFQGLMNDVNILPENQPSNSSKAPQKTRKTSKKSQTTQSPIVRKNWSVEEDIALTKAWLYVSVDVDIGVGQKLGTLWSRILQSWRNNMVEYDLTRNNNALGCRWGTIQTAVNKFHGVYERLERSPPSGATPEVIHRLSVLLNILTLDNFWEKKMKGIMLRCEKKSRTSLYSHVGECDLPMNGKGKAEIRTQKPDISDGIGIAKFFTGKVLFITGATGFLAKVLVEKILRTLPDVSKIFLLINAKDKEAAMQRLKKEIINTELFKHMPQFQEKSCGAFLLNKLVPVVGNLCESGLGMEMDVADIIADEADIIVNSAGDTTFDQRYDVAIDVNTLGPCRLLSFAKRCKELKLFLHVSTAYVNGQRRGIIPEKQFKNGESIAGESAGLESPARSFPSLDVEAEVKITLDARDAFEDNMLTQKMKHLGLERARTFGWQDTYTLTKAMGEMLIERERGDIPVVIIRPSIIESTYREPIPGWIEGIRMLDPMLLSYGKGDLTGFPSDANTIIDMIPADMVVNAMLAAIVKHARVREPGLSVYHIASSVVNPVRLQDLFSYSFEYFDSAPYMDLKRNPIKIQRVKLFNSMVDFDSYIKKEKVPRSVKNLANIYEPYGFYKGRFDITNTQKLLEEMSQEEKKRYGFDVRNIDWKSYWCDIHIPGLMTHAVQGRARL